MIKCIVLGVIFVFGIIVVVVQDVYVGLLLDYGCLYVGDNYVVMGLLGGLCFGDSDLSYGVEVDVDLVSGGLYDVLCLCGMIYNDMGKLGLFVVVGVIYYDFDVGGSEIGINYGLGVDYEFYGNMIFCVEVICDYMLDYIIDVIILWIGVIFGFQGVGFCFWCLKGQVLFEFFDEGKNEYVKVWMD